MITTNEAFRLIHSVVPILKTEPVSILESAGRVLAERVMADRDLPPFHRVAMDGIAIQASQFVNKNQAFKIESVQAAGSPQQVLHNIKNCIEVMTGSVLPVHTDAVIRYEDLELKDNHAQIQLEKVVKGMNIHAQGLDTKRGDDLLKPGQKISPAEIALLASVGKNLVSVFAFPTTAVVSTGNELVEIEEIPEMYQIRRSNTYALQAAMNEMGWKSASFHVADDADLVLKNLREVLEKHDVVILTGGVSKGKFDFIPQALEELGVRKIFHQVSQRPGKPFWFGASDDQRKIVFALPGNPVSTFLCFYKYIKSWMLKSMGVECKVATARLSSNFNFAPSLTCFLQVKTELKDGQWWAQPHAGGGSGDFANLKDVDGFLELPLEKSSFQAGEVYPYIAFRM